MRRPDAATLQVGEGAIVDLDRKVAAYRDGDGLRCVSATCTHLGCEVRFQHRRALVGLPLPRLEASTVDAYWTRLNDSP